MLLPEKYEDIENKNIYPIDVYFSFDSIPSEEKVLPDYDYESIAWGMKFSLRSNADNKHFHPLQFATSSPAISAIKKQIIQQLKDFISKERVAYQQVIND